MAPPKDASSSVTESRCSMQDQQKNTKNAAGGAAFRHSGEGEGGAREGGRRMRGRAAVAALSCAMVLLIGILGPPQQRQQAMGLTGVGHKYDSTGGPRAVADAAASGDMGGVDAEEGSVLGMAASSSMWGVGAPATANWVVESSPVRYRRGLLFNRNNNLRGAAPTTKSKPAVRRPLGEPNMLNDFNKDPVDTLDLDDVMDGHLWIPVSLNKFDINTTDPLVKMCQVNYDKYSEAPWLLPMGGLLSIHSGCADIKRDTVQIMRMSTLKRILAESEVPITPPTGFIFHETRCGSTLVSNMLASVKANVMWSESTGPWKVMHTCPKCRKDDQIVPWLKVVMDAMTRSARHTHFYFKFQSSEDIEAVTTAFPDTPWIFIFREPIEVMMSRLGAQRIGMEGMEKEVAARVEKGMKQTKNSARGNAGVTKGKAAAKEATTAQQLSGLCKKAIAAYEANPGMGMMVEYPHLPEGIVTKVLPDHYRVTVSATDRELMMGSTRMYSKVASFAKGPTNDSKFTEDVSTKHDAASVAVQEAAQSLLYPDFYKLRSLSSWPALASE